VKQVGDEKVVWRSSSMEGKWKDGAGDVRLASLEFYGKRWIDLRIINTRDGKNQHTRHGVRLTLSQAKQMLPRLVEAIAELEDAAEEAERSE
jgi:hypothetical protein